jgi:Heavy metal associated domain 2
MDLPPLPSQYGDVASHIPGRLRMRFPQRHRRTHHMAQLKQGLERRQGITDVAVNQAAGSVTVQYDVQVYPGADILGVLQDLHVIVGTVLGAPHLEAPADGPGSLPGATTFTGALEDLDQRVAALTGHPLSLRTLVPLSLVGWGLWRSWQQGLGLGTVPGWLLLWLGFDAFMKLHPATAIPAHSL